MSEINVGGAIAIGSSVSPEFEQVEDFHGWERQRRQGFGKRIMVMVMVSGGFPFSVYKGVQSTERKRGAINKGNFYFPFFCFTSFDAVWPWQILRLAFRGCRVK